MTDFTSSSGEPLKLTFRGTIVHGVGGFLRNIWPFLQVMALPLLLSTAERIAFEGLLTLGVPQTFASAIWAVARAPVWAIFGVAWVTYLLAEDRKKFLWLPSLGREYWRFTYFAFVTMAVPMFAIYQIYYHVIATTWPEFSRSFHGQIYLVIILLSFYLPCRFGPAFCALLDRKRDTEFCGLAWSWRATRRATISMILVLVAIVWLSSELRDLARFYIVALSGPAGHGEILSPFLGAFFGYINFGVMMAIWAYAYRQLTASRSLRNELLKRFD